VLVVAVGRGDGHHRDVVVPGAHECREVVAGSDDDDSAPLPGVAHGVADWQHGVALGVKVGGDRHVDDVGAMGGRPADPGRDVRRRASGLAQLGGGLRLTGGRQDPYREQAGTRRYARDPGTIVPPGGDQAGDVCAVTVIVSGRPGAAVGVAARAKT